MAVLTDNKLPEPFSEQIPKPVCWYARFCCCDRTHLCNFVKRLQTCFRQWFAFGTDTLATLMMGMVVLQVEVPHTDIEVCFHISHADRNFWRVALMEMHRDPCEFRQARAFGRGQIALQVAEVIDATAYVNLWHAFKDWDLGWESYGTLCVVSDNANGDPHEFELDVGKVLVEHIFPVDRQLILTGHHALRQKMQRGKLWRNGKYRGVRRGQPPLIRPGLFCFHPFDCEINSSFCSSPPNPE